MGRGGRLFGSDPKLVRVSMLGDEETFNLFLERLSSIQDTIGNGNGNGNYIWWIGEEANKMNVLVYFESFLKPAVKENWE